MVRGVQGYGWLARWRMCGLACLACLGKARRLRAEPWSVEGVVLARWRQPCLLFWSRAAFRLPVFGRCVHVGGHGRSSEVVSLSREHFKRPVPSLGHGTFAVLLADRTGSDAKQNGTRNPSPMVDGAVLLTDSLRNITGLIPSIVYLLITERL